MRTIAGWLVLFIFLGWLIGAFLMMGRTFWREGPPGWVEDLARADTLLEKIAGVLLLTACNLFMLTPIFALVGIAYGLLQTLK